MMDIEMLETSYTLREVDDSFCNSSEDAFIMIKTDIDTVEEDKISIIDAIGSNSREVLKIKIMNFINFFEYEDYTWIEEDTKVLDEEFDLVCKYLLYYNKLLGNLSDDNFKEIYKLGVFVREYYASNIDYLEDKRDEVNYLSRGIYYRSGKTQDTREVFDEFFNKELERISSIKPVEKTIKI